MKTQARVITFDPEIPVCKTSSNRGLIFTLCTYASNVSRQLLALLRSPFDQRISQWALLRSVRHECQRTIHIDLAATDLEERVRKQITRYVQTRVRPISCSDHHRTPKVAIQALVVTSVDFQIIGCCETLCEAAQEALEGCNS